MRELSACDFCGGEAAGVYEVVPGDIPGVSARRMVLCEGCRDTLADIVDPLLEAGRAGGRANAKRGSEVSHSAATTSEPGSEAGSESASATGPEPTTESDVAADPPSEPDAGASADPAPAAEPESESESAPDTEPAPESDPQPATDESAEPAAAEQAPVERPAEYGKVVRLVENRDAGIPRSDLEELATSAYGLSHDDVEEAIDFALEHGTFEETSSGLKTT